MPSCYLFSNLFIKQNCIMRTLSDFFVKSLVVVPCRSQTVQ